VAVALHPVGDYSTETDFYGDYAQGAALIQQGQVDFSRFGVVGPVHQVLLALVGFAAGDLLLAAELISVFAACGTLILWLVLAARRAGTPLAVWTIALLAVNATFFLYGYSATTDALATCMQAAALLAMLGMRGPRAPLVAGVLSAIAALTRYNAIYLLPAAMIIYGWIGRPPGVSRRRAIGLYLLGFAAVAVPWIILAMLAGHPPGGNLYHNIAYDVFARPHGISWDEYQTRLQPQFKSLADVITRDPGAVVRREISNLLEHARLDLELMIGWPAAVAAGLGFLLALRDGTWRRLLPIWLAGALLFLTLVPAFHSARYSLPLAPLYSMLAAVAITSPRLVLRWGGRRWPIGQVGGLTLVIAIAVASVSQQRQALAELPKEVVPAAAALRAAFPSGGRVLSRKPHIAHHAGMTMVPFPVASTLAELAAGCERDQVDCIYFSWPEANTRPEFTYLLDPAASVPGLEVVFQTADHPAVVYRIGPGFGAEPAWIESDSLRTLHVARALRSIGAPAWRVELVAGLYALDRNQLPAAAGHFMRLAELEPGMARGWSLLGTTRLRMGLFAAAVVAFTRAVGLEPGDVGARQGLGWAELQAGDKRAAAAAWSPIVRLVTDAPTLEQMAALYEELGDRGAAEAARAGLARLR
jgi:hypothetical protein